MIAFVDRIVAIPAGNPSCCAIGGARLDTLYVTTARVGQSEDALREAPDAGGVYALALHDGAGLAEARFDATGLPTP